MSRAPRSFVQSLFAIRWSAYATAYGSARLVPWRLACLRLAPTPLAVRAGHALWCSLCHQHAYASSAALPAAPFLIDVLERRSPRVVQEALEILLGFLRCTEPSRSGGVGWQQELRATVLESLPTVERLAGDADPVTAEIARSVLAEAGAS